jgi:signal transduction histidine kinase
MRRLLGVLRTDDVDSTRAPQPGVAQIDGLVEQVRVTGLTAELTVTGSPVTLTPGAGVAVYRIVQEALTNTLKHAVAPSRVRITLRYRPQVVEVEVCDDGGSGHATGGTGIGRGASMGGKSGAGGAAGAVPGHGLAGMRERAAVYGGIVSAGPQPGGGWRVKADLPVEAVAGSVAMPGSGLVAL